MNLSYFIAKRISFKRTGGFTGTIHRIAVASVAIGLAISLISFMILGGFQNEISNKVFSFTGHYQGMKFMSGNAFEESPTSTKSDFYQNYPEVDFIKHVQVYAHKPGLLKGDQEVEGVLLKGVDKNFDSLTFKASITKGRFIHFSDSSASNEILLSKKVANKLLLDIGESVTMYFVQEPPRFRRFEIVGLYETYLENFDDKILIGDIQTIRNLNGWTDDQVGGFEIFVDDPSKLDVYIDPLYEIMDYDLKLIKITDKYLEIFDWLTLLNNNVYVFLGLILFVAAFNMVSILFILIMERTQMIGILKAVGAKNSQIRKIFVWNGIRIIGRGLLIGNAIGLGLGFLQDQFKLIPLDPESYYMAFVPIHWNWPVFIAMNLMILLVTTLVLFVPAMLISNIKPIKAIRFD
ncbi:ABC transporter permease [Rhodonellum psychrophilum GCM71 = DSM 17998]|uniref:ABC transporter permease n=2 Tax=Rhodonellum TaxID=336827 RepID=U5BST2_9BACT|nr:MULTISPECIES: FtsX-like permease family protein [Rhodonellum]ERM80943.1 ABC transporter permease [Rhodonellum psychrophilum GCM71 = DSM 17998]SDY82760.1 lipoprotein-releasing system permease protein [Rhodonellum ikkaensis]